MKRSIIKIHICLFLALATLGACKKFLNDVPKTSLTTGNAYNTAANMENALTACYQTFYGFDYWQWEYVMLGDERADNAYPGGNNEETFYDYDRFNLSPNNTHNFVNWSGLYTGIARCNILLEKIKQVEDPALTEERRAQIVGEASFLRAFFYAHLVKLYGGVPLELESNTADPSVTRKAKATETEVYDQIVADLSVALENLPDTYGAEASVNKVRATKGAANAMMAKIWAQRTDRDYNKVLTYCNAVMNSPAGYSLLGDYSNLFDGLHYLNSESILEIPFVAGSATSASWGIEMYLAPEDGWQKYCVPSKDLVNAYVAAGDAIRENASIVFWNKDANGDPIAWPDENWNPCGDPGVKIPFNYKQKHPNGWASGDHYYLLRLADLILLRAEAENELGNSGAALADLNTIRQRVKLKPSAVSGQANLRTAILNERRLELAFEGQRWDDLVRSGQATDVMLALNEYTYSCVNNAPGKPVKMDYSKCTKDRWILPIPQQEMDANPNLKQNSGY